MRGFFSSRFGGSLLERLIYIRERGRKMRGFFGIVRAGREVVKGRGRKHGKDQWENLGIQKPV